jgi:hypothetical protein
MGELYAASAKQSNSKVFWKESAKQMAAIAAAVRGRSSSGCRVRRFNSKRARV